MGVDSEQASGLDSKIHVAPQQHLLRQAGALTTVAKMATSTGTTEQWTETTYRTSLEQVALQMQLNATPRCDDMRLAY